MVLKTNKVALAAIILSVMTAPAVKAQALADLNQIGGTVQQSNPVGINGTAIINSNLEQRKSTDYSANSDFSMSLMFRNFPFGQLNLFFNGTKDLSGERQFRLNDGSISNIHNLGAANNVNYALIVGAILPLSENSIKNTHLNTRLMVTPIASYQFKHLSSSLDWLTVSYRPSAATYFHDYKVAETGASNPQYLLGNRAIFSIALSNSLFLDLDAGYNRFYSYQGTTWDTFNFDQSISYAFNAFGSVFIGHNNSGNALAPNGRDSNFDFFNNRSSTIYSGLNILIP